MKRLTTILAILLVAVTLDAQTRITYLTEMRSLKQKFDISFVYDSSLQLDKVCRRYTPSSSLEKSLDSLFSGSGIEYEVSGKTVILRRARTAFIDDYQEPEWVLDTISSSLIESAWVDTLATAVKIEARRVEKSLGRLQTGLEGILVMASPLGEGDAIHWAQSLPGVTSGADGTTSMFVRGGGSGNNLFSLDGVPVYGYSHILGLTTVIPSEAVQGASLAKGGFDGADCNFTAAHLRMSSKEPSLTQRTNLSLNNFLVSAEMEGPIGGNLSYIASLRWSPLTYEYRTIQNQLPELVSGLSNFSTTVGDVYGKLRAQTGSHSSLEASFLGSIDRYGFDMPGEMFSSEVMNWNNRIGLLRFQSYWDKTRLEISASANLYGTSQKQDKTYRDLRNVLSLRSQLNEYTLSGSLKHTLQPKGLTLSEGMSVRYGQFSPGQVAAESNVTDIMLSTLWVQAEYVVSEKLTMKGVARGHLYSNLSAGEGWRFDPDGTVSAMIDLTDWLSLELTGDRMAQYYHTLEGMPVGWSLDMVVPSGPIVAPETSLQGNAGFTAKFGDGHSVSLGGFYKAMDGLIYYKYAQSLFSGALTKWENQVDFGKGTAFGGEFLYEYLGKDFYARLAYTLSKTIRHGFADTNNGMPFNARFDRPHVLNALAQWKGLSATFTLQSGNWENGAAETFDLHLPGEGWTAKYFSGVNNYRMPTVIRLDLGYQFDFNTGDVEHKVNLGVCNVTNHFNPFMLYFDGATETWNEIAILPIMPNFSWRVAF